jgi:hypothetical protein
MLRCVDLVRTEVSEELNASFIRVTRIGEQGTTLAATSTHATKKSARGNVSIYRVTDIICGMGVPIPTP